MSMTNVEQTDALASELEHLLGSDAVIRDAAELQLLSTDVYSTDKTAALAIVPTERHRLGAAVKLIAAAGFAMFPRGGGMSYTGGYLPTVENSVVIDTSQLNAILEISEENMTITVEAGVTWQQIYEALLPRGLRLPFYGTFSGSRATVGGGMSNGALFMGTARYGTGAEIVLGMEVVTATGKTLTTGQAGFKRGKPYYRSYGPDLTGLFVHDAGALGIKTVVTMRMMEKPAAEVHASFVCESTADTVAALSDIARSSRAEEVYVFDPVATRLALNVKDLKADVKRLLNVVRSQGSISKGIKEGLSLVGAGRKFVAENVYTLHVVCSAASERAAAEDMDACRHIAEKHHLGEIANSMPKAARANPFEPLNGILGHGGSRWAALNSKVAHSDALQVVEATGEILARHEAAMQQHGVFCTRLFIAISNHVYSFEPVLRWNDEWLPLHKSVPEPSHLANLTEPAANPEGRALVDTIRREIVALFAEMGVASTQIGKTYAYYSSLQPETAALVLDLKKSLDPNGLMNPGALSLPVD